MKNKSCLIAIALNTNNLLRSTLIKYPFRKEKPIKIWINSKSLKSEPWIKIV